VAPNASPLATDAASGVTIYRLAPPLAPGASSFIRFHKYHDELHLWFTSQDNGFEVVHFAQPSGASGCATGGESLGGVAVLLAGLWRRRWRRRPAGPGAWPNAW